MNVRSPRFPLFDSLRAIAALSIFFFHLPAIYRMAVDNPVKPYLFALNVGVAVFFLISGFLLYRPFAQARYEAGDASDTRRYAERRALRIVPAYWVALVAVVLLVGPSGEAPTASPVFTPEGVIRYFGFLQIYSSETLLGGISAAWSLCVEVTFYIMLPLWALLLRRFSSGSRHAFLRSELLGLALLFAIGVTWNVVAASNTVVTDAAFVDVTQIQPWLYVLPAYLDQFAAGMALAVLSVAGADRAERGGGVRLIERSPWLPWLLGALAFVAIANVSRWFDGRAAQVVAIHELQIVVALGLLLPAIYGDPERGWVRRLLGSRVLLWIGLVSFGLYLWHVAVNIKLVEWGVLDSLGSFGYVPVALSLSLAVAAASYYVVERPAVRLGRRLSHRRRPSDAELGPGELAGKESAKAGAR